jgi:transcriptional regulator with XRE-family HTH domain
MRLLCVESVVCALYPLDMGSEEDLRRVKEVIGARLKARRKELGWSQEKVAELAEIHLRQYNKIENAKAEPRASTLIRLAGALEIPPRDLLDGLDWIPNRQGFGHIKYADN